MRSTIGRQLNSKAERWYHGEGEGKSATWNNRVS